MTESTEERFWDKVLITESCWLWTGAKFTRRRGYGRVTWNGKNDQRAHRVAFELHCGSIPQGEGFHGTCVLHECDNPACVRPSHLKLGTQTENLREMRARGRGYDPPRRIGENNSSSKLKTEDVRYIKSSNETNSELGHRYGVTPEAIYAIRVGKNWRHVQ